MASYRLLTSDQVEKILSVLRKGYEEKKITCKHSVFKRYSLRYIDGTERIVRKSDGKVMVSNAEAPDIIRAIHEELRHSSSIKTWSKVREKYGNIPRRTVQEYINKCQTCMTEKYSISETEVQEYINKCQTCMTEKYSISETEVQDLINKSQKCTTDRRIIYKTLFKDIKPDLENRGHIDVIQMPSDGVYRFTLHYTLIKTSFSILRPMMSDTPREVAFTLCCVFMDFGYPDVLQSHSSKFTSDIIKEINKQSPKALIISGKYKEEHKQLSLAVKDQLVNWMSSNLSTKWTRGLQLVQWEVNNSMRQNSSSTPFQSLFNRRSSLVVSSFLYQLALPGDVLNEEEIEPFLDFCMPIESNPSLSASSLPVHSVLSKPNAETIPIKRNELIVTQRNNSSVQALESFKRKIQCSESDDTKKIKIIASFSLATDGQTAHRSKPGIPITSLNNEQEMVGNHVTFNAVDKSVINMPLEIPVDDSFNRLSNVIVKQEQVDETDSIQTENKTVVDPILFQAKNEPVTICPLPVLEIKEELIVPDTSRS